MKTLNSLFKQVFANGLREYGYIKIKGRQPYFARMIGDEIVQVITYENVWCGDTRGYKAFGIFGGGATVYRETINLNRSPRQNNEWLNDLSEFYVNKDPKNFDNDYRVSLMKFLYNPDDEESIINAFEEALDKTKMLMLPVFDGITNLYDFVEFYEVFQESSLFAPDYVNGDFDKLPSAEGLLYIKTDNHDDFIERYRERLSIKKVLIEKGRSLWKYEDYVKTLEEGRIERIKKRDAIYQNPEIYEKAQIELQKRKESNIKILRSYGLEI